MQDDLELSVKDRGRVSARADPTVDPGLPNGPELLLLLDELVGNDQALADAAARSYKHQLGFEKYVLRLFRSGASLRLHHWRESVVQEEDIHSHCAGFQSKVLLGELTHQIFRLVPGETHAMFDYRFDSSRGMSEVHARGLTAVQAGPPSVLRAGASYTMAPDTLHRVSAVAMGTATVSTWGPRRLDAVVLKPSGVTGAPCSARAGMESETLRRRLQEIRERLAD